jgi:nitrite reductase/ring-hydroxylating ferredoxin subunit
MSDQVTDRIRPLEGVPSNPEIPLRQLSPQRYTSAEFAELEARKLWPRVWQVACREDDVANPGDYIEYEILDQSVIVARQPDLTLKAFYNVCRHRGMPLVCGAGNAEEFRCPFHAWTYGLDGRLSFVLSPDEFPPGAEYSLAQVQVDTWGGFVFVNLDGKAQPLAEYLAPVQGLLAPYGFDQMILTKNVTYVFPCNWKLAAEAFMESYHSPGTHPQLMMSLDDVNVICETFGLHSRMINDLYVPSPRLGEVDPEVAFESFLDQMKGIGYTSLDGLTLPPGMSVADFVAGMIRQIAGQSGLDVDAMPEEIFRTAHSWLLFPNMQLQCTATEVLGWRARPNGADPNSCLFDQWMLRPVPPGTPRQSAPHEFIEDWTTQDVGLVLEQDFTNLSRNQKGIRQAGFTTMLLAEDQELRIRHLHDMIDTVMAGER